MHDPVPAHHQRHQRSLVRTKPWTREIEPVERAMQLGRVVERRTLQGFFHRDPDDVLHRSLPMMLGKQLQVELDWPGPVVAGNTTERELGQPVDVGDARQLP